MANSVCEVLLAQTRLEGAADTASTTAQNVDPSTSLRTSLTAGAIVDFWGVVRKMEEDREIDGIDYEAHQAMAEHQLRLIAENAAEKFQLKKVILHHRVGFVAAGEASLFLQVQAAHRAAAFEASKWIVDELKKKVPIWKRPRLRRASGVASADSSKTVLMRQ
jgi:molybdopterin synthase catalytic subunit